MMKPQRDINSIIHDVLTGEASAADRARLTAWLQCSDEHRQAYEDLKEKSGLDERYRTYATVDEEKAWKRFQQKHLKNSHRFTIGQICRCAALLILPVAGVLLWMYLAPMEKGTMTLDETAEVIARAEQMGKVRATLVLADGEEKMLTAASVQNDNPARTNGTSVIGRGKEESGIAAGKSGMPEDKDAQCRLSTHPDSEYWMTFEDGSVVHLNYNTTLKYPPRFSARHRTVYLKGEAYFYVAKDEGRPFRVITEDGVITEYGTSFNVNTHTNDCTQVVLVKGSIGVSVAEGKEQLMRPGELAVLQCGHPEAKIKEVNIDPYVAWHSGRFAFDGCSLDSLMEVISQWYGCEVVFGSDAIRKMTFTGDVDRYSSVEPILKAVRQVTDLDIRLEGNKIILKEKHNIND